MHFLVLIALIACSVFGFFVHRRNFMFDEWLHSRSFAVHSRGSVAMERCPSTRIGMLDYIGDRMDKADIEWALLYGSLLGAVRDRSVIPWTADVDVGVKMLSADRVQAFFQGLEREEGSCFTSSHRLHHSDVNARVFHLFPRAPHIDTIHFGWGMMQTEGVYLDVYGMYEEESTGKGKKAKIWGSALYTYDYNAVFPLNKTGAELEGRRYPTPRMPNLFLAQAYGATWRTPDADKQSGYNAVKGMQTLNANVGDNRF